MRQKLSELSDNILEAYRECLQEGRDITFLNTLGAEVTRLHHYWGKFWAEMAIVIGSEY